MPASADLLLKPGDRVVFYGDSITEQRLYSRYVQQYVYCRYPDLKIHFYNAGWSGNTAADGLNRLDRDVLPLKPTLVTLFFGMNDGEYRALDDTILSNYRAHLEGIIKALTAKGVRVVVFTPGCVDPDKNPGLKSYNDNLEALGAAAIALAKKYDIPYGDVFHPMLAFQSSQKAKSASYTLSTDGVHPMPTGHEVMAYAMLQALGVAPMPPLGSIDLTTAKSSGVRLDSRSSGSVTLEVTPPAMPYWVEPDCVGDVTACGFGNYAGQLLTVKGLSPGDYTIAIGKTTIPASARELASGVPILGTYSDAGQSLHDLAATKEDLYYTAWRRVKLALGDLPGVADAYTSLLAADDALNTSIYSLKPTSSTIVTIMPKPLGANLALGKKYAAVDANIYGWGNGGLTDGSWEASPQHCFASGADATFPKTVTIDLEQVEQVGAVVLGVPPFGATETIQVSVSTDGTTFTQVGSHVFASGREARFVYGFTPIQSRYVRLTYPDHYADQYAGSNQYIPNFVFTTECEVYAALK